MNGRSTGRPHTLRTFERSDGSIGCGECCWGDRCDDPTHFDRRSCPYCKGTGSALWLEAAAVEYASWFPSENCLREKP